MKPTWDGALCAQTDPDLWFPDKGQSAEIAQRICDTCPLRSPCLNAALDADEQYGVWGGLTVNDRQRMRRARRAA